MVDLNDFREEWFAHEEWWFDSTNKEIDQYLSDNYKELLFVTPSTEDNHLSWVIVYDQLARHVYRDDPEQIKYYLAKALEHADQVDRKDLTGTQLCFALLPYRHTNDIEYVNRAIMIAFNALESNDNKEEDHREISYIKRFIKAAYTRHPLNDSAKTIFCRQPSRNCTTNWSKDGLRNIREYANILEWYRSNLIKDVVALSHPCCASIDNVFSSILKNKKVIVSLSGGKDSMVVSYVASILAPKYNIDLCAVHINYCNRGVINEQELLFLQDWCQFLDIKLYWRNIDEINRQRCMNHGMRDIYETFTRNVRFDTYKRIGGAVLLGHNKDDCFENIMTNIVQEKKYENLLGMDLDMMLDDIQFIRPFVGAGVAKTDIIEFAKQHRVPYLYTSTPIWSQRGKIRNTVLPCMLKWDNRCEDALFALAGRMQSLYKIMDSSVDKMARDTNDDMMFRLDINSVSREDIFWFEYFKRVCGGAARPSKRSLASFLMRLDQLINKWHSINIDESTQIVLSKSVRLVLIKCNETQIQMQIKID